MNDSEKKKLIKEMRECIKKITPSDDKAKRLLVGTGMYNREGKLKPQFK